MGTTALWGGSNRFGKFLKKKKNQGTLGNYNTGEQFDNSRFLC